MVSVVMVSSAGVLSAFVTGIPLLFGVFRVITGMGGMGCYMISYVWMAENTRPKYVLFLTLIIAMGWIIGELIMVLEAYLS